MHVEKKKLFILTPNKFLGSILMFRLLSKDEESRGGGGALCTGVLDRSLLLELVDVFGEE